MSEPGLIRYLTNQQIDKTRWDGCIERAENGLIYACSFYLDNMARNWDALVLDDYEIVMPLTWNKKFGIHYLYQPFLTAQLGVFGNAISATILEKFLLAIPFKFKYWDIYGNPKNLFSLTKFKRYARSNYVLDLGKPYDTLFNNYRENIQRNLKKAYQSGCTVQKDFGVERVIELALLQMKKYSKESKENTDRFRSLYQHLYNRQMAVTYGIISSQDKLLSSAVFFFYRNRAYYILVGNHPDGKTTGASHALIDSFIKDHAGKNIILDFEGSDIPSLAFFYSSFGAVEEIYAGLKRNKLPFYLKWLKS